MLDDSLPNRKKFGRWRGKRLTINGYNLPINEIGTETLIKHINSLKALKRKSKDDLNKIRFLGWMIMWRNRRPENLPKHLRYLPSQWSLAEITEYNYPEGIYELSILYQLALIKSHLGRINLLHDILLSKGFIYRRPKFVVADKSDDKVDLDDPLGKKIKAWQEGYLEVANPYYSKEDLKVLRDRGLIVKNPKSY